MAQGRTLTNHQRLYMAGGDFSGYALDSGEQSVEHATYGSKETTPWADPIIGVLTGKPTVTFGPFVGVLDSTAVVGLHPFGTAGQATRRNILLVYGIRAAPAVGDPVFCAPMLQLSYKGVGKDIVTATMSFAYDQTAGMLYDEFWGNLVHTFDAESGANSSNTPNVHTVGASTTAGGWLMYQVYYIDAGTATISIDDSDNGTSWAALSGATTTALAAGSSYSGIVQLGVGATVRQYLRFQLALAGGAGSCIFALAFMRGR